jgi:glycosyltransferase involved in cell wall biosynthesis
MVPVSQPDALAERLNQVIDDAELRQRLGQAGRATIQARNDYRAEMAKMESLYQQVAVSK